MGTTGPLLLTHLYERDEHPEEIYLMPVQYVYLLEQKMNAENYPKVYLQRQWMKN